MLISIITVCLNAERTIGNTLESVLNQDYENIQYIIKDGNSSDSTNSIIDSYKEAFRRKGIKIIHIVEEDRGIYHAMNCATAHIEGQWCFFLNADDSFYDNKVLSTVFGRDTVNESYVLYGGTNVILSAGRHMIVMGNAEHLPEYISLCHQSCFIRADVMKAYGYDEKYRIASDYNFMLRLYSKNPDKFRKMNLIVSNFARNGISGKNVDLMNKEMREIQRANGFFSAGHVKKRNLLAGKLKKVVTAMVPQTGEISFIVKNLKRE